MSFVNNYSELRNDFVDDGKVHIDGWKTDDDDENGTVLATVDINTHVVSWKDDEAQQSAQVQQFVRETIQEIKNKTL